jgi:hypothetical protein
MPTDTQDTRVTVLWDDFGDVMELGSPNVFKKSIYGRGESDRLTHYRTYELVVDGEPEMVTHVPNARNSNETRLKFAIER